MWPITGTKLQLRMPFLAIAFGAAMPLPAAAQDERLTVEVGECVDLATPEERLACFEARVEEARREAAGRGAAPPAPAPRTAAPGPAPRPPAAASEPAPRTAGPPPQPAAAPAEPTVVEARVRPAPRDPAAEPEPRASRREQERAERLARPEIVATVAGLRETVPNAYLITLDNGQIWRQTVPMRYGLREGQEVRLYPSRWGDGYRLTNDQRRGYIQVERVR
jgi:hypothetical protein